LGVVAELKTPPRETSEKAQTSKNALADSMAIVGQKILSNFTPG
jgi:hypothetical protein